MQGRDRQVVDSGAEVAKAYAPYAIIVAIFSFTNLPAVKEALAVEPWTYKFAWPGLDVLTMTLVSHAVASDRRRARAGDRARIPSPQVKPRQGCVAGRKSVP